MFFETKSEKTRQNKYLPWFCKLFSLKFPQLLNCGTWGLNTAKKASLARVFLPLWVAILSSDELCNRLLVLRHQSSSRFFFLTEWIWGKQLSNYKTKRVTEKLGTDSCGYLSIVFKSAVKMSDISLCYVYFKFHRLHHGQKSNNTIWKFPHKLSCKNLNIEKYDVIHPP